MPISNGARIESGFVYFYVHNPADTLEIEDGSLWNWVDFDGVFNIWYSKASGLTKKTWNIVVARIHYRVVSYYREWNTVDGSLIPFSRYEFSQCLQLCMYLAAYNCMPMSSIEIFRLKIEVRHYSFNVKFENSNKVRV